MAIERRAFLFGAVAAAGAAGCARIPGDGGVASGEQVLAVLGPVEARALGPTLPHEHLFLDFRGAAAVDPSEWDEDAAFEAILPHLLRAKAKGIRALAECTPIGIGRNPGILARLSRESGVAILTNTGYYAAAGGRFLAAEAAAMDAAAMAEAWIREFRDGIDGTGIRPGFIKIGVDGGPLGPVEQRIVRAAARSSLATGMAIAAHTGDAEAMRAQLAVLDEEDCPAERFIWVHAQISREPQAHLEAARRGAWVEFDGLSPTAVDLHLAMAEALRAEGLLGRVLLSHDAGWHDASIPGGGDFRFFGDLMDGWIPAARAAGWREREVEQVVVRNPAAAFALRAAERH